MSDKKDCSPVSSEENEDSEENLFQITSYPIHSQTGQKLRVFTCGDVFANFICQQFQEVSKGLTVLENFLQRCEAEEGVHGINAGLRQNMFDLLEKCQDTYNRCCESIERIHSYSM